MEATRTQGDLLFAFIARVLVLLTVPALVLSALLLFIIIQPMSGLSAGTSWSLGVLALAMPCLCTFGPARASIARTEGRTAIGWLWLLTPLISFAAIGALVIINRS